MIRMVALVAALIAAALLLYTAGQADSLSASPGRNTGGAMIWPAIPAFVLAWVIWKARIPGAAFVMACLVVVFVIVSLVTSLSGASDDAWSMETSWGLNNLIAWIGLVVVGAAALFEHAVRAVIGARLGQRVPPDDAS